jgi:hypothetical protein
VGLQKFGGDRQSLVGDALFVDPVAGDYSVKEGSPALKLGFRNFPMVQFGVRKPSLRKIARTPPLPGTLEAAQIRSGGWGRRYSTPKTAHWLGARIKNIESQGEMSAVGLGDRNGVLLAQVPRDSAASRAGLKENDVIRTVNGQQVRNLETFAGQYQKLAASGVLTLGLWRNQGDFSLKIGPQP